MPGKILIVEDEQAISDTITYALSTEGFESVRVATGREGVAAAEKGGFDLAVMDVGLPDGSGFDCVRRIRKFSNIPVIFLTARGDEIDRVVGLELGADDYVVKPFSPRELVARIKAVLRRVTGDRPAAAPAAETQQSDGPFRIDAARFQITFYDEVVPLSRYEYRLLVVLIQSPGRVFTREHLMALAWEEPDMSLERTVDTHIKTIRSKLKQIRPSIEAIITHRGIGYSLREDW